jgi:DNA repair protein RadC
MRIKDIPKENRPRERFVKSGASSLSDAELLAVILQKGSKEENVIDMSNRLISKYGLDKLSDLSLNELQEIKGIGPAKAMQIKALFEFNKRHNLAKNNSRHIKSAKDIFNLFSERLKDEKQEKFIILMLNSKNWIIAEELISIGSLDSTLLHPREIFKPAIKNSASKIVLIHNHPSGDVTPSESDRKLTDKLLEIGEMLDINVVDHVIVGAEKWWSWREEK